MRISAGLGFPVDEFISKFPEASGYQACPLEVFPAEAQPSDPRPRPESLLPSRATTQKRQRQEAESTVLDALKRTSEEVFRDWLQVPEGIRRALYKFHVGLGHISHVTMMRMLRRAGARPEVIKMVPLMPCGVCGDLLRSRFPRPVRAPHGNYNFNHVIGLDILPVHDVEGLTYRMLNIVCLETLFQVVAYVAPGTGAPSAEQMIRAFSQSWSAWAGYPNVLQADLGRENLGRFPRFLQEHGVEVRQTPLGSPWQQALVERSGTLWKQTFEKVAQECSLLGEADVQLASGLVTQIRNDMCRHGGYSPAAWVLGARGPRVPGSLLDDTERNRLEVQEACLDPKSAMGRSLLIREAARMEFMRMDNSTRIRRALLRNVKTNPAESLEVGMPVYFRRQQTRGVVKWHGLARIIGFEGHSKQRVWLRHGATTVLVSAQQVRVATPDEVEAFDLYLNDPDLHQDPPQGYFDLREPLPPVPEDSWEHAFQPAGLPAQQETQLAGPDFGDPAQVYSTFKWRSSTSGWAEFPSSSRSARASS